MRASQRRWTWSGCVLGLLLACVLPAFAARLVVEPVAATSQGFPVVEFELFEPFEGIYEEAMNSGLPTTLTFTIEVWRQRSGWWDKLEATREREFRLFRDLLNDVYVVVTPTETRRFSTLDSLATSVSTHRTGSRNGPQFLGRDLFRPGNRYYVVIVATLAPLTVEDLNELDAWVRGSLRGGREDSRGISGLSRTMGGILMSMTGFGDQRVKARTAYFRLDELPMAPRPPARAPASLPAQLAAPDSGSGG